MTTFCRDGTNSDSSFDPDKLGARCVNREMLERGSLRGRFVSAPMMRCEAARWLRAERTWGALKAGFSGTYTIRKYILHKRAKRAPTNIAPSLNRAYVVWVER